jgi:hypothetical protein
MQSPKSQRPQDPGRKEPSDNLTETTKGGTSPGFHNPSGSGKPSVPSMDRSEKQGHKGNVEAEAYAPTGSATPSQAGSPKLVDKSKGDQNRTGGSVHQT